MDIKDFAAETSSAILPILVFAGHSRTRTNSTNLTSITLASDNTANTAQFRNILQPPKPEKLWLLNSDRHQFRIPLELQKGAFLESGLDYLKVVFLVFLKFNTIQRLPHLSNLQAKMGLCSQES